MNDLIIRADATSVMGVGHVMRMLGLAQAWRRRGGNVVFCSTIEGDAIRERVVSAGFDVLGDVLNADDLIALAKSCESSCSAFLPWIVVDGYHFDRAYFQELLDSGFPLLVMDDMGLCPDMPCTLLVNQNAHARKDMYGVLSEKQVMLGSNYVILREEFLNEEPGSSFEDEDPHVVITMGGADPDNITDIVVEALSLLGSDLPQTTIVVGAANPRYESIIDQVESMAPRVQVCNAVSDMSGLLRSAGFAVAAAGTTAWELAYLRIPSILIATAFNQIPVAKEMAKAGAAVALGLNGSVTSDEIKKAIISLQDSEYRKVMARAAGNMVSGDGSLLICRRMRETQVRLSLASEGDMEQMWQWANAPEVRAVSLSSEPIDWSVHVSWFKARLADPGTLMLIGRSDCDVALGYVRFRREDNRLAVSVVVEASLRGLGVGESLIRMGCESAFAGYPECAVIEATILRDNKPSVKAFELSGFSRKGSMDQNNRQWEIYELNRENI